MSTELSTLEAFYNQLPHDHIERAGVARAIEVLRHYAPGVGRVTDRWAVDSKNRCVKCGGMTIEGHTDALCALQPVTSPTIPRRIDRIRASLGLASNAIHKAELVLRDEQTGYEAEGPEWFEQSLRDAELYVGMAREAYNA